jgi:A/G-specific adenine glycosylase
MTEVRCRSEESAAVRRWYDKQARDLPWRQDPRPWPVLVSEVMLQQTPVARVRPVFEQWMTRWPTPASLAAETPGEAVRAWGRLGYPRRSLRLHAAAVVCTDRFDGQVPSDVADLLALPGVGEYTAAAVAAFAFGVRQPVLDTNVRRVHARWLDGTAAPLSPSVTARERSRALELLPPDGGEAARLSVAVMELGALVCTARNPACRACPLARWCAWYTNGSPQATGVRPRRQSWRGTDRQCRGQILSVLRDHTDVASAADLRGDWPDAGQFERALASLVDDGLAVRVGERYRLP